MNYAVTVDSSDIEADSPEEAVRKMVGFLNPVEADGLTVIVSGEDGSQEHILVSDALAEPQANELIKDRVKVEWIELGEGWSGDYDEDDPNDEKLLRFDVSYLENGEWVDPGDASYCTLFPVSATPEQRRLGLELLMSEVYEPLMNGHSIKKICERLSWINLGWLSAPKGGLNACYL